MVQACCQPVDSQDTAKVSLNTAEKILTLWFTDSKGVLLLFSRDNSAEKNKVLKPKSKDIFAKKYQSERNLRNTTDNGYMTLSYWFLWDMWYGWKICPHTKNNFILARLSTMRKQGISCCWIMVARPTTSRSHLIAIGKRRTQRRAVQKPCLYMYPVWRCVQAVCWHKINA